MQGAATRSAGTRATDCGMGERTSPPPLTRLPLSIRWRGGYPRAAWRVPTKWVQGVRSIPQSEFRNPQSPLSSRRWGGAVLMVLIIMFALLAVALTALSVVAASAAAVEREYRSSQALALAEAGLAMAKSGAGNPAAAGGRRFDEGEVFWTRVGRGGGCEIQRGGN